MERPALYLSSHEAWAATLVELEGAQQSIDIEHFIFTEGGIGEKFLEVLERKARAGIRVRLLLDAIGSSELASGGLAKRCKACGIKLRFFNSIVPLTLSHHTPLFFRDHQKLVIVDGTVGMTGGVCIDERMRHWRDSLLVLEGDAVAHMGAAFEHMWARARKEKPPRLATPSGATRYLLDMPFTRRRPAYRELRRVIRAARRRILLEMPYFVPPHRVLRLLRNAARRNVEVCIVLPVRSDATIADLAAESYFSTLLEAGVRIFRYGKTTLHAKAYVVDRGWAMLGSHNVDRLSFQYNFEGSVVTLEEALVDDIARSIEDDIRNSTEVTPEAWSRRGLIARIKEVLIWPMRFFL